MDYLFFSISTFRNSIIRLCKKERDGYHLCKIDIYNIFKDLSFDDIWAKNYLVRDLNTIRVIKIRIPNSFQNLSSADGYRLIICCNRNHKTINFLNIYPKRGKLCQMDQSSGDYVRQLKEYLESYKLGQMIEHENTSTLEIIVNP